MIRSLPPSGHSRRARCHRASLLLALALAVPALLPLAPAVILDSPLELKTVLPPLTADKVEQADNRFLVQPYLQLPAPPTGMTVMWETKDKLPGLVEYGTSPMLGSTAEKAEETILQEVRITH